MTTIRIDLRRFDEAALAAARAAEPAPAAPLAHAWRQATRAWGDRAAHDAVLGLAARHGALGWLAARYRERTGDPIAARQLERVCRAAAVVLLAARPRPPAAPAALRGMTWWLALCALVLVGAVAGARAVVARTRSGRAAARPVVTCYNAARC